MAFEEAGWIVAVTEAEMVVVDMNDVAGKHIVEIVGTYFQKEEEALANPAGQGWFCVRGAHGCHGVGVYQA